MLQMKTSVSLGREGRSNEIRKTLSHSLLTVALVLAAFLPRIAAQANTCQLNCFDAQVSLDENCEAVITVGIVADTSTCPAPPQRVYSVILFDEQGDTVPTSPLVTEEYIGQALTVKVLELTSGQSCWSTITIEDKMPPVLDCECSPVTEIAGIISESDPTWNRPASGPPNACVLSAIGTDVNYDVFEFGISVAGMYTFVADGTFDGVGAIYSGDFDPMSPCTNIVGYDDDGGPGVNPMLSITLNMSPGDYTLVTTTFSNGTGGAYTWSVSGPGVVLENIENCIKNCSDIDQTHPLPSVMDNCSDNVQLILLNQEVTPICHPQFIKQLTRWWTAIDESGNQSDTCMQVFFLDRLDFNDIDWPDSFTVLNGNPFLCDEPFADANGDGTPDAVPVEQGGAGVPTINGIAVYPDFIFYCNAQITYEDIQIGPIGCVRKTMRIWTAYEWHCSGERDTIHVQLIEIVDNEGPELACPADLTMSTGNVNCEATVHIPVPYAVDNCNDVIQISVAYPYGFINNILNTPGGAYVQLPVGVNDITFTAYDECYNSSQCVWHVTVEDHTAPVPVCDEHTVVSLTNDYDHGLTLVAASVFDDGSYDECGPVTFQVRRMDSCIDFDWTTNGAGEDETPNGIVNSDDQGKTFKSYVPFACCDVNAGPIMIVLRVTDASGNSNTCMVEVTVQDKLPPVIQCPAHITLSCDFDFDLNNLSIFGTIQTDPDDVELRCVYDPTNPNADGFGYVCVYDGLARDNCDVTITESYIDYRTTCGTGEIVRSFLATDPGGLSASCTQHIYVHNFHPFYIEDQTCNNPDPNDGVIWPCDYSTTGCGENTEPDVTGRPIIIEDECDLIGVNYDDQVFEFVQGACLKILRTWRIIDWCQYGPNTNGGYYGYWEYMQVIKVTNTEAPEFLTDQEPISVCNENDCDDVFVELIQSAEDDCTPDEELRWAYTIDLFNNTSIDYANSGFGATIDASRDLPIGYHRIVYSFEDGCGSETVREQYVEVLACKPPTPVCLSLAADLMPVDTDGDGEADWGMVVIWATDFDASSYHACGYPITLSFSPDTTDKSMEFTCNDLGLQVVQIWVTDQVLGNQDYCTTTIDIQDNNEVCEPGQNLTGTISGQIVTESSEDVKDVNVSLQGSGINPTMTNGQGAYAFPTMPLGGTYTIMPDRDVDWKNGVTTLDLILIQKHLLGIQALSSPYKMIAADANKSGGISALDIVAIRRLILGVATTIPENTSWRFVDAAYDFVDPSDPFNEVFAESVHIAPFASTMNNVNFIGIKVGDINNTVVANLNNIQTRSNPETATLQAANHVLKAGEQFEVAIEAGENLSLEGYQFTLAFDPSMIAFDSWAPATVPMSSDNINVLEAGKGRIMTSWSDVKARNLTQGDAMFTLRFTALADGTLDDVLSVISDPTVAEAYNAAGEVMDVAIRFQGVETTAPVATEFELLGNRPNPFTDATTVQFITPRASEATITIYDVTGQLVFARTVDAVAGLNEVEISHLDARGVLYCQVSTDGFSATRKMIRID